MGIEFDKSNANLVKITIMGVGGGGGNAVNRMCALRDIDLETVKDADNADMQDNLTSLTGEEMQIEYVAVNTDSRVLEQSKADFKVQIGDKLTEGTGAGGNPEIGEKSAEESREKIEAMLKDTKLLILTAGMGGGTGTGASPYIAEVAREMNILTVAIVTKPFQNEGRKRMKAAVAGIERLHGNVDSLLVIPNQKLISDDDDITLAEAYRRADDILAQTIRSVSEIVSLIGYINLDFADLTSVLNNAGYAHLGIGIADLKENSDGIIEAAEQAIAPNLLETSIHGAKSVLINIIVPSMEKISMRKLDQAINMVTDLVDEDADIFSGYTPMPQFGDRVRITLIATRFGDEKKKASDKKIVKTNIRANETVGEPKPVEAVDTTTVEQDTKPLEVQQNEVLIKEKETDNGDVDSDVGEFNIDDIMQMLDRRTN